MLGQDANEERWGRLLAVVDPESTGEAANAAVFAGIFNGYTLSVDYDTNNPFKRVETHRQRTCHYHPKIVGDPGAGEIVDALLSRGCAAGSYEMRSLVPALSYMHDLLNHLKTKSSAALNLADLGDHEAAAALSMDTSIAAAQQVDSILQHLMERLAVLRRLSSGNHEELALYNGLYDAEHRNTGSMGRTEAVVDASVQSGVTRNLVAASARAAAQRALPPPARTRQQQQTAQQTAAQPRSRARWRTRSAATTASRRIVAAGRAGGSSISSRSSSMPAAPGRSSNSSRSSSSSSSSNHAPSSPPRARVAAAAAGAARAAAGAAGAARALRARKRRRPLASRGLAGCRAAGAAH